MKKLILFVLLAFALFPKVNFACTCVLPPTFCEGLTNSNGDLIPNLIVRGKVLDPVSEGFKIMQVILGETNQDKVTWGVNWCTHFEGKLEENEEYIFALSKVNDQINPLACRIFYLKIENEIVKGKIAPGIESLPYNEMAFLKNCGNAFSSLISMEALIMFPNPANGQIKIKNSNSQATFDNLQLKVYDLLGRLITSNSNSVGILPEETWAINIENLASGVYIFKLSGKNGERNFKIVKQRY